MGKNQWTDPNGTALPADWTPALPLVPNGNWTCSCGCAEPGGTASVDNIKIIGSPGTITSVKDGLPLWELVLSDGTPENDMRLDRYDDAGEYVGTPFWSSRATGIVTFNSPVMLSRDPVEPMEPVTLEYLESHAVGIPDAPDNQTYGRTSGAWNLVVPAAGGTFTGQTNLGAGGAVTSGALVFAGNAVCSIPDVSQLSIGGGSLGQVPATDGNGNLSWVTPVTGGPYLPIAGGTVTGSLTVNQVLTVQGSNSLVLNAPVTGGNQRSIMGMASNVVRWILTLGDQAAEGVGNAGSNFSLSAYSTTGAFLGTWLSIARADGSTVFNGGVTMNAGLAVNGLLAVNSVGNFYLPGGTSGQVLSTNGSGVLSWANQSGGIPEAPLTGTQYGRQSGAWTPISAPNPPPVTISDSAPPSPVVGALWWDSVGGQMYLRYQDANSTQWTPATNAASLPPPASTTVLGSVKVDGTSIKAAVDGTISTVLVPMGDNKIINGDMRIDQRGVASGAGGTATGYTCDRWTFTGTQTNKGTWQRLASVPVSGFPYALVFASNSAYTPLATDTFFFAQPIEADQVSDFQWGSANAQPVTLSFWVNSSITGMHSGSVGNYAGTRAYPFTFSNPTANNWTKIVVTIPGDTAGTWVMAGNGAAVTVHFDLGSGANYRGPAGAWGSVNANGANGAVNVVATNGAQFLVTGVKLEIGSVATPFNRQSLAKSMADCQRYYQTGTAQQNVGGNSWIATWTNNHYFLLPVVMRAAPTTTVNPTTQTNCSATTVTSSGTGPTALAHQYTITAATGGVSSIASWTASAEL